MFEKVNLTQLGIKILTFLARNPDKEFYLREIAKNIDVSVGGTHKVLKSLYEMSFVKVRRSGKNLYYQVNYMNPSIKNFKIFVNITELNPIINDLIDNSEKIVLFGSCATGEDTSNSDIDLLIISKNTDKVENYLKKKKLSRKIQATVVTTSELIKLKEKDKAFYEEIAKGIPLWENKNE
jgi:predicted nucleotidyltransferase